MLLSEISSVYSNLPVEEVDKTIESGLQRLGEFLGADRCNLVQFSEDGSRVLVFHSWIHDDAKPDPGFIAPDHNLFPWFAKMFHLGKVVQFSHLDDLPAEAATDITALLALRIKSQVSVPISVGGHVFGTLSLATVRSYRSWPDELVPRLRLVGEIFANALVRKQKELQIRKAFQQIKELNEELAADCTYLREEIDLNYDVHHIIGQSLPLKRVLAKIQQIALTDTTVLILGETGTGKELVARAIHAASQRRDRPMVKVNCASLPANLIESELFGHEKGAFTSAQVRQIGRFEFADRNTLFLDEIGELPLESQAKLLRVLQEGEFERLGSSRTLKVDVRIVAATNRDLEEEVRKGRFRQDLWYRLNIFPITVPPLRERTEDIPLLINLFVNKFGRKLGKSIRRIPAGVMKSLQAYDWPGNVRELENVIERAAINTVGPSLQLLDNLKSSLVTEKTAAPRLTLEEAERSHILQVLADTNGRIEGPKGAALILGINHSTLRARMRKLGIHIRRISDAD
nr:sigma 54-interacting transcriptional regulator [Geobacter metallireducens]